MGRLDPDDRLGGPARRVGSSLSHDRSWVWTASVGPALGRAGRDLDHVGAKYSGHDGGGVE